MDGSGIEVILRLSRVNEPPNGAPASVTLVILLGKKTRKNSFGELPGSLERARLAWNAGVVMSRG